MKQKQSSTQEPTKFRYSIVRKLSSRLFARLFGILLSFNIIIIMLVCFSLVTYSENNASKAVDAIVAWEAFRTDNNENEKIPQVNGVKIIQIEDKPDGFHIIRPFAYLLPNATENSIRRVSLAPKDEATFLQRLDGLEYHIYFTSEKDTYEITVSLGTFFHYFRICFIILLVIEFLTLLSNISKNHRLVKKTLDPISELAAAAHSLNQVNQFDPDTMAAIAGKLEGINAAKLDTRIQVDETQDELMNLALAINHMLDRIDQSYRAQVRFVSDASHELRTPISVIQGYANLLDRWGKNDEKTLQESITAIKDEAANMKDLVEQLLFLARGDNNTMQLQLESINLSALVGEVVHETEMIDSTHHFDVRLFEIHVSADRSLIKQALRILVDNAIKYTDAGGHITVTVEKDGDYAKLSVTDDGIGISPEIVPQIFDRFYRADESRTRATGGAGLGLSIAKWIATRHGGHMEVISREGIGTKIMIALPILHEDREKKENSL
jgi:signal transduction histidine kinase